MSHDIGLRISALLDEVHPGVKQQDFARSVGMDPSAFSRALNGKRGFATDEVVAIAHALDTDSNFLLTGDEDPLRVRKAARCTYSPHTRSYIAPSADDQVIQDIKTAYAQVWPDGLPQGGIVPDEPARVREMLGDGFVHDFAHRVEEKLGIDVIQIAEVDTDYTLWVGKCQVILLNATPYWFRRNWSLAHELAHVARNDWIERGDPQGDSEYRAHQFAAELLAPAKLIREIPWAALSAHEVAQQVLRLGVSTEVLRRRLSDLGISIAGSGAQAALALSTPKLINAYLAGPERALFARAEQGATARKFPNLLVWMHQSAVDAGTLHPGFLAWMLGVQVGDFDAVPQRDVPSVSESDLAAELGLALAE